SGRVIPVCRAVVLAVDDPDDIARHVRTLTVVVERRGRRGRKGFGLRGVLWPAARAAGSRADGRDHHLDPTHPQWMVRRRAPTVTTPPARCEIQSGIRHAATPIGGPRRPRPTREGYGRTVTVDSADSPSASPPRAEPPGALEL